MKDLERKELENRREAQEKYTSKVRIDKERKRMELLEKREREKLDRLKQEAEWKKLKKKISNQKYLHEKYEEDFNQKVVIPELEKKKEELKEKREFYKPIDHKEIDQFQKKYEENFKRKLEEKRQEREKWYSDIGAGSFDPSRYKTKVMEKVLQEQVTGSEIKIKELEEKKRKAEKMNNYSRIVKEMHWPQVSTDKAKEIEHIKSLLDQRNKRRSAPPKKRGANDADASSVLDGDGKPKLKKPVWNFVNPLVPKPKEKKEFVKVDYLRELKERRQTDDNHKRHETGINWDVLKDENLDDKTKIELLKARTKLIEENADRKEKMNKLNGSTVEDNIDINDMLIDAIEMKLSILDQIE